MVRMFDMQSTGIVGVVFDFIYLIFIRTRSLIYGK